MPVATYSLRIPKHVLKTVEESACIRGYDAHKCVKGRKRHLLVDILGLPIASYVTSVDVHDTVGARKLLAGLAFRMPRLKKIWADAAYRGKDLADWCQQQGDGWELEIVEREHGTRGFQVQPRRWVVERCFAWLSRNRRMAKDYERKVQTSETLIEVAAIRLVLRRQAVHDTTTQRHNDTTTHGRLEVSMTDDSATRGEWLPT